MNGADAYRQWKCSSKTMDGAQRFVLWCAAKHQMVRTKTLDGAHRSISSAVANCQKHYVGTSLDVASGNVQFVDECRTDARSVLLLLLHERLAGVPGLADLVAGDVVAALELIEDERVELRGIDLYRFLISRLCLNSGCTLWLRTSIRRRSSGEEERR